jgi:hypothetical protein
MEEVRSWVFLMVLGLLFFLGCSSNGASTVTVEATGVKALTWDWTQKESAVQVTATSAKLITNNGVAVMTGATAKAEPTIQKTTSEWEKFGIRMLVYAGVGIGVALLVQMLKRKLPLGDLRTVAVLVAICLCSGGGVTALFRDAGMSSIISNPSLLVTGVLMVFFSAYVVNQVFLKGRA